MKVKNYVSLEQWEQTPELVKEFIIRWKRYYYPSEHELLSLHQCIELLMHVTRNLHRDDSDGRFFNNLLTNMDSVIGWDDDGEGSQLIDTLYYEIIVAIKNLVNHHAKLKAQE